MSRKTRFLIPLALLVAFLGYRYVRDRAPDNKATATAAPAPAVAPLKYGQITFTPCALNAVGAMEAVEAQCATVTVPENHAAPNGRQIELALAWIPAEGEAEPDPLVMIAGGPGQSALQSYPLVHAAFADARRNRHVLLLDARGTGGSHALRCPDDSDDDAAQGDTELSLQAARDAAQRCSAALGKTSDLRYYTTADHISDLDLVRERLGIDKVNLVGISYGTRVAQQFAKRFPGHTRTLTLDSVAPNTLVLGQEHARNLEAALTLQFARCKADAACTRNLGDPATQLASVRAALDAGDLPAVRYRDPVTGDWRSEVPEFGHLAMLLRMYAYLPQAAAMLPLIVHEAAQGHYESLLAQARMTNDSVSDAIYQGMELSVLCSEDGPDLRVDAADVASVLGTELVAYGMAQCATWPTRPRPAGFREPLTGDTPVLAISGEYDPVTPPRYGEAVVSSLPNGRHLVLPGQGHSVLGIGCMPKLFAQFIESADAKALDAQCLQRLQPTPPFAGRYGWEP